ncbi:MAG: hypothetical protein GXP03_04380 [Alphaproteobacteria bacterium]|nr:hypothetical protein [Alphaproteobacteria bacterium]
MKEKIVQTALGITIIGAGRVSARQIAKSVSLAPYVVAADGGAKTALKNRVQPDLVIGDFDGGDARRAGVSAARLHRIDEQVSTDFEKCLYSIDAPFAIAHGVTGSRFDHSLAAMNAIARQRGFPVLVLSGKDVIFLSPPRLVLHLPIGTRRFHWPRFRGAARGWNIRLTVWNFRLWGGLARRTGPAPKPSGWNSPPCICWLFYRGSIWKALWMRLGSAIGQVDRQTTKRSFFILLVHIQPSLAHGFDTGIQ